MIADGEHTVVPSNNFWGSSISLKYQTSSLLAMFIELMKLIQVVILLE